MNSRGIETNVIKVEASQLDLMAAELQDPISKGVSKQELDAHELSSLVTSIVTQLVNSSEAKKKKVKAAVRIGLGIEDNTGRLDSTIVLKFPMKFPIRATIEFYGELANDDQNGGIRWVFEPVLEIPDWISEPLKFLAQVDVNEEFRYQTGNPNKALHKVLAEQMVFRGVELGNTTFSFQENRFVVVARRQPLPSVTQP